MQPVCCGVCLFTSQLSLVVIVPTHRGMARLSGPGSLVMYEDGIMHDVRCRCNPKTLILFPRLVLRLKNEVLAVQSIDDFMSTIMFNYRQSVVFTFETDVRIILLFLISHLKKY